MAGLGYEYIELSPRADFLDWWVHPRAYPERIREFKQALSEQASSSPRSCRCTAGPSTDEVERQAAVAYWNGAIESRSRWAVDTLNSEFGRGPHPRARLLLLLPRRLTTEASEAAWWRSMEELVPVFEKEGVNLHIEPHPEDWVETLYPAVDMIRTVNSKNVKFLYCAPHTFYFGDDMAAMIR